MSGELLVGMHARGMTGEKRSTTPNDRWSPVENDCNKKKKKGT